MSAKVAIVTGANKGIGFAIVRGLCKRMPEGIVYLTARNKSRGEEALLQLFGEGLHPVFHRLDITEPSSVIELRDHIMNRHGGIDILVNNAAIAFKHDAKEPASVQAEQTLFVNYFSTLKTCEILFPILKDGARVVNVSSSAGHLKNMPCIELRRKFQDPNLTIPQLSQLMQEYIDETKQGTQLERWGNSSYAVSKVGLTALTRIQQKMVESRNINVNAVHPGWVDTDMSSHKGTLTPDEGAQAPLYLALDAADSVKGQYIWHNKVIVDWEGDRPAAS